MKKLLLGVMMALAAYAAMGLAAGSAFAYDFGSSAPFYEFSRDQEGKPRVIIDTDLGSSMDDLLTIDLAARMHKQGKLDLMAVMMNRPDKSNPEGEGEFLAFADRYLASLGFADLPIGKSMPLAGGAESQYVFNPYWTLIYSNNVTGVGLQMPTNRTDIEIGALTNAVSLYRRLLEDAPDKSVVVCSIGFLNNLKALMESGTYYDDDGIALTGMELIAAKVKELRIMGGCFDPSSAPDGTNGAEYNFAGDPAAAKKVVEEWPTPVIISPWEVGLGLDYKSDEVLADFPAGTLDPIVRAAHMYWFDPGPDAMNRLWDTMTLLPLVEGETLAPLSEKGGISVDEHGKTTFVPNASSNRCYQIASDMDAAAVMNRLRSIYKTGNPSLTLLEGGTPEPGVDYNGSELVFTFENIQLGSYAEEDLAFHFVIGGADYAPESSEWDEALGVLGVRFVIPPDAVTAGNVYDGTLTVTLENDELGSTLLMTEPRQLVQGVMDGDVVNANVARIDGGDEYATVAEAIAAANGSPIRLLHAASWSPTEADIGRPLRFLDKGLLNLDCSYLPYDCAVNWTDEEGDGGTLTLGYVVTLADPVLCATAEEATNALSCAVFAPSVEVAGVLTTDAARERYAGRFKLGIVSKAANEWYIEAALTDAAKSHLADTAAKATRQIPVAEIAALAEDATMAVTVTGCEPGFYYTLYDGADLTGIAPDAANRDALCGADGTVAFPAVSKPSDAMGFFRVGVSASK